MENLETRGAIWAGLGGWIRVLLGFCYGEAENSTLLRRSIGLTGISWFSTLWNWSSGKFSVLGSLGRMKERKLFHSWWQRLIWYHTGLTVLFLFSLNPNFLSFSLWEAQESYSRCWIQKPRHSQYRYICTLEHWRAIKNKMTPPTVMC